jgi:ketosteroid isomerase-like protein
MSDANVDLVRRLYEEFNETLALPPWALSEDVVWYPPADEPDNAPRRGAEAVAGYVREWAATFAGYHCEVEGLIDRGDDVVAPIVLHGRIGDSAAELTQPLTQVFTIRDGAVVQVREYRTRDEALTAHPRE